MDRLIKTAWRAFWVGLGAAAVLVSQSVLAPPPSPADPSTAPLEAPSPISPPAARGRSTDPVLSRSPAPLLPRCATVASLTRCS